MNKKQLLITAFSSLLLFSLLAEAQFVRLAGANFLPVPTPQPAFIIRSDGSVDPPTASIQRTGEIYTFTDNIIGYTIAVERDNVILDGSGYTLQGTGSSTGVFIRNRNSITVRNMEIRDFSKGIRLLTDVGMGISGNHILSGNNLINNGLGISISYSSNNVLRNNQLNYNVGSIYVTHSVLSASIADFVNDIDESNTVNGKPVIYWVNQHDKVVPQDAGHVGLVNCTNITVQNQNLIGNRRGIMLAYTDSSVVTLSTIQDNADQGIYMYRSSNNSITKNIITKNGDGIVLSHSSINNIFGNTIIDNQENGIYLRYSSNNTIFENSIAQNFGGVHVYERCANNTIIKNSLLDNSEYAVSLDWAYNNNFISTNFIAGNGNGIFVKSSSNNRIIGNKIQNSIGWAIRLEDKGQRDNMIYHNYFINNNSGDGLQVSIPIWWDGETHHGNPNIWDDGEKGNYWSDYFTRYTNASEVGITGIGDTPFYINPNNIDNYPIVKENMIPEFPSWTPLLIMLLAVMFIAVIYKRKLNKGSMM